MAVDIRRGFVAGGGEFHADCETMRYWILLIISLCVGGFAFPAWADDWSAPHPVSFHSRGFVYVAEIFPPTSRQNPREKPVCYFYQMGYPGTAWEITPNLQWMAELVNKQMPYEAVVSMDGHLVTLNEWASVGFHNAVAIYDLHGKLVKTYSLDDLLPKDDVEQVERSRSSRHWNRGARYYFLRTPARLYIWLSWHKALAFSLGDGAFRYGSLSDFPDLAALVEKQAVDEEAEIWATSLRFSSITDVMDVKAHQE